MVGLVGWDVGAKEGQTLGVALGLVGLNVVGVLVGDIEKADTPSIRISIFVGFTPILILLTVNDNIFSACVLAWTTNPFRFPQHPKPG